jgi:MtrB/PioB family decaheme-associated outer membrane protein
MRTARILLATLVVLAGAGVASAQTKTQLGGWNVEGSIESGVRFLPQNPNGDRTPGLADGKFEEYRDINQGLFLEDLRLRIFRPDEAYSFEIAGKNWGLHTQEFHLLGERLGQWQLGFDWDQMRHIYSTDSQSLLKVFGGNVFILPSTRPPISTWNSAKGWGCTEPSAGQDCDGQISQQWYTGRLFFKLSPTPNTDFSAELTRIYKDGQRPFGMAFGSPGGNFLELVQPISQTIYEFKTRGSWTTEMFQLQGGYTASVFVNDFPWVRADNPCVGAGQAAPVPAGPCTAPAGATPGQFGTTSLPPNNQAHTFNLSGGINLPMRTRINSNFTYQLRFQNQDFQQQTYSNSLVLTNPRLQLPQSSLNGNVQTALFNFDVTSRPLQAPVTFTLKYRLYDYMDLSDTVTFGAFIINDQNSITDSPYRAGRYSFLRQNADLAGRYQFMPNTALTLGVGWEGWNRSHDYEVSQSDEALAKAAFDYTPTDWLFTRLSYTAGFRRGGGYNSNAWGEANGNQPPTFAGSGSQQTTMRKFNEGDRNQQVANLMLQITPTDKLSFTPSASYKIVDYVSSGLFDGQAAPLHNLSLLGVQQVVGWNAGMDVNWTPTDRISFAVGYMHESNFQKQRSRNSAPNDASMDWISDSTDTVETFHGSMKATILPEKLVFKMNGAYSQALGRVETYSPNATGSAVYSANQPNDIAWRWPAFYDSLARIDGALEYNFTKAWTGKLFYTYEQFINHNWQTGALTPFLGNSVNAVFLGQKWQNYTAQILGVTLKYKFE